MAAAYILLLQKCDTTSCIGCVVHINFIIRKLACLILTVQTSIVPMISVLKMISILRMTSSIRMILHVQNFCVNVHTWIIQSCSTCIVNKYYVLEGVCVLLFLFRTLSAEIMATCTHLLVNFLVDPIVYHMHISLVIHVCIHVNKYWPNK